MSGELDGHGVWNRTPERRLGFIVKELLDGSCNLLSHNWNTLAFEVAWIGESQQFTNIMRPHEPPDKRMSREGVPNSTRDSVESKSIFV